MKNRNCCGQEATEFVLISILVFFSALLVVFIFGSKISKFFTQDNAAVKVSKNSSIAMNPAGQQKYNNDVDPYTGATKTTAGDSSFLPENVTMPAVTENADGSLSFSVAGQNVTIPSQMVDQNNTVFQTTGSTGSEDLIKEIAYMIQKHKAEYPNGNVPIDISYGLGNRVGDEGGIYKGTAQYNCITIKSGNDVIVLQNDQTCSFNSGGCCQSHMALLGTYRVEGTIDPATNQLNAQVTSDSNAGLSGSYSGNLNTNNDGSIKLNGNFTTTNCPKGNNYCATNYDWELNFSKGTSI